MVARDIEKASSDVDCLKWQVIRRGRSRATQALSVSMAVAKVVVARRGMASADSRQPMLPATSLQA